MSMARDAVTKAFCADEGGMGAPVYENGRCYVEHEGPGLYRVYRSNMTHAVLRSTIDFPSQPDYALERAKDECDRRAVDERDAF